MERGRRIVLAEGETTGHAHAIVDHGASLYELVVPGDVEEMRQRFLRVEAESGVLLLHEEHGEILIPKDDYEVRRQREYNPLRTRVVSD